MRLQIDPERCELCRTCKVEFGCFGQIVDRPTPNDLPVIDEERCYGCGACTLVCIHDAVVEK